MKVMSLCLREQIIGFAITCLVVLVALYGNTIRHIVVHELLDHEILCI